MQITLESTESGSSPRKVIVFQGEDALNVTEIIDDLIKPVLLAYGFHPDTIEDYFKDE